MKEKLLTTSEIKLSAEEAQMLGDAYRIIFKLQQKFIYG
jgi:hypothetical protein